MHAELARRGVEASLELVRRLMRLLGLVAHQVHTRRSLTRQAAAIAAIGDLVRRDFTADEPYTKLIGDITEIKTWEGKVYLATVIDCFNKEVIGYAMADHFRTELPAAAIEMAAANHRLAPKCIFHSDRGSNYTSHDYAKVLERLDLRQSLGRTGICFDDAAAESFSACSRPSVSTVGYTRQERERYAVLCGTSSCSIIVDVSTRRTGTGLHVRSASST